MKKPFLFFIFLLSLPIALALYGGETGRYYFDKCNVLRVNITATLPINATEYTILNDCIENGTDYYICDCDDNYYFNVTFKLNAINNYTFSFDYNYSQTVEEDNSGGGGGGGGGGGSSGWTSKCVPDWECTNWGNCQEGNKATRKCFDSSECNATRPNEERYCYYYVAPEEPTAENITIEETQEQQEPLEEELIKEIQEKDIPLMWWILLGIFAVMIIIVIVFFVKTYEWV